MSIIRIGLAETRNFSDGYDLIFGKPPAGRKPASKVKPAQKADGKKKKKKKPSKSK